MPDDEAAAWRSSGLEALTGRPDGPGLGPPPGLVGGVRSLADEIARLSARLGRSVTVDPLAVMAERAVLGGWRRAGDVSCGGASRLLRAGDGWMAVSLARPDDWDLVAAWLEPTAPVRHGRWEAVAAGVARASCSDLVERGALLGLPVAAVGERPGTTGPRHGADRIAGVRTRAVGPGGPAVPLSGLVVADLSALWAGPLVGALLARAGARVAKIESDTRGDGARRGQPSFYRSLNADKSSMVLALGCDEGRRQLRDVLARSDVVITAARPRAVEQLGLDPGWMVGHRRPTVWLSITGYGSGPGCTDRVAFGDDAAAAGGLVVWDGRGPCFCADAVADPVTGLAATAAVLAALDAGGGRLVEASMADVAAGMR
ncbi:MAG: CoA transferase [Acidimicrobiales bacterium]